MNLLKKGAVFLVVLCLSLSLFPVMASSDSVTVTVRIEGANETLLPKTTVTVDNLDLSQYGISTNFTSPKVIHAIIKALTDKGYDCANTDVLNPNGGGYITRVLGVSPTPDYVDAWMYMINNSDPGAGADAVNINNGDSIVLYYSTDVKAGYYGFFDKEEIIVNQGESFNLSLYGKAVLGSWSDSIDGWLGGAIIKEISNGNVYGVTDESGNVTINNLPTGVYNFTAEKIGIGTIGEYINLTSRPYVRVIVRNSYTATIKNTDDGEISTMLIVASYKNGKLMDAFLSSPVTIQQNGTVEIPVSIALPEDGCVIRTFTWKDATSMMPVKAEVTLN